MFLPDGIIKPLMEKSQGNFGTNSVAKWVIFQKAAITLFEKEGYES